MFFIRDETFITNHSFATHGHLPTLLKYARLTMQTSSLDPATDVFEISLCIRLRRREVSNPHPSIQTPLEIPGPV